MSSTRSASVVIGVLSLKIISPFPSPLVIFALTRTVPAWIQRIFSSTGHLLSSTTSMGAIVTPRPLAGLFIFAMIVTSEGSVGILGVVSGVGFPVVVVAVSIGTGDDSLHVPTKYTAKASIPIRIVSARRSFFIL